MNEAYVGAEKNNHQCFQCPQPQIMRATPRRMTGRRPSSHASHKTRKMASLATHVCGTVYSFKSKRIQPSPNSLLKRGKFGNELNTARWSHPLCF